MPTDDYIKRSDALNAVRECFKKELEFSYDNAQLCMNCIKIIPTTDVEPKKYAEWIIDNWGYNFCSYCKEYAIEQDGVEFKTVYCPHCGAKMEKE